MEVFVFTPPPNGLVAFNLKPGTGYGIYLGVTSTSLRVFNPYTETVVVIDVTDTDNYACQLTDYDYRSLVKFGLAWSRGVLVEYLGERLEVGSIRNRYPPYNNDILVHPKKGQEIVITDPLLRFVGHTELNT